MFLMGERPHGTNMQLLVRLRASLETLIMGSDLLFPEYTVFQWDDESIVVTVNGAFDRENAASRLPRLRSVELPVNREYEHLVHKLRAATGVYLCRPSNWL